MSRTIADQLRNLRLTSNAPKASGAPRVSIAFEPPGKYLKRLHRKRLKKAAMSRDGYLALPSDGTRMDAYRTGQARYEKFVPIPHASPQWGDTRITASGI